MKNPLQSSEAQFYQSQFLVSQQDHGYDPVHLPVFLNAHKAQGGTTRNERLTALESDQSPVPVQLSVTHHLGVTLDVICVPGNNQRHFLVLCEDAMGKAKLFLGILTELFIQSPLSLAEGAEASCALLLNTLCMYHSILLLFLAETAKQQQWLLFPLLEISLRHPSCSARSPVHQCHLHSVIWAFEKAAGYI